MAGSLVKAIEGWHRFGMLAMVGSSLLGDTPRKNRLVADTDQVSWVFQAEPANQGLIVQSTGSAWKIYRKTLVLLQDLTSSIYRKS